MNLTLRLIEQATVLGRAGNFAKAAEQLGISQPTLSRNIAALEEELGLRLFDRGRAGATLTVFGRVLTERGARVLGEAQALRAELMAVAGMDSGLLEIVAGPYAVEDPIAEAVARLHSERPRLRVRVHLIDPDEVSDAVRTGRYELGLGGRECLPPREYLTMESLSSRRLYLACRPGHPLADVRPSLAQVLSYPLVTSLLMGQAARAVSGGTAAGMTDESRGVFAPSIEVNSFDAARRIARSSDALFPATPTMLAADLVAGHLSTVDFDVPALRFHPTVARLSDRTLSPAACRFLEIVRAIDIELAAATLANLQPTRRFSETRRSPVA
jgi:LysR family hydrogen peroxide-inducible transcriptional activator